MHLDKPRRFHPLPAFIPLSRQSYRSGGQCALLPARPPHKCRTAQPDNTRRKPTAQEMGRDSLPSFHKISLGSHSGVLYNMPTC